MPRKIISLLFFLFLLPGIRAQEVKYLGFEPGDGGKVFIYYELTCSSGDDYQVSAKLKRKSIPSFELVPSTMSGDIGVVKCAGGTRTIVWLTTPSEEASLEGDDFYFEIAAKEFSKGGIAWYYYVAAVLVGGGSYFLLANGGDDGGGNNTTPAFPSPPGRP